MLILIQELRVMSILVNAVDVVFINIMDNILKNFLVFPEMTQMIEEDMEKMHGILLATVNYK